MQRPTIVWLLTAAMVAGASLAGGCHRRRPRDGTCAAHIDCAPGYDCVARRCSKRAAAPGTTPEALAAPTPEPAARPFSNDPPAVAPAQEAPAPPRPRPAPVAPAPIDNTPAPPPPDLPPWKARLKSI